MYAGAEQLQVIGAYKSQKGTTTKQLNLAKMTMTVAQELGSRSRSGEVRRLEDDNAFLKAEVESLKVTLAEMRRKLEDLRNGQAPAPLNLPEAGQTSSLKERDGAEGTHSGKRKDSRTGEQQGISLPPYADNLVQEIIRQVECET